MSLPRVGRGSLWRRCRAIPRQSRHPRHSRLPETRSRRTTRHGNQCHEDGTASGVLAAGDLFKISQKDADGNVLGNMSKDEWEAGKLSTTDENGKTISEKTL